MINDAEEFDLGVAHEQPCEWEYLYWDLYYRRKRDGILN